MMSFIIFIVLSSPRFLGKGSRLNQSPNPCAGRFLSCIIQLADSVVGFKPTGSNQGELKRIIDRTVIEFVSGFDGYLRLILHDSRFLFPNGKEVNTVAVVNLRNGESQDSLLKRFRKKVVKSGVLSTVRRKRWFVSKSETRRMEKKKAIRRIKRRSFKDTE